MVTTSALHHDAELELDGPTLELALRDLWHEAARSGDGRPVARVRALNLIVYTEDEQTAEFADTVLGVLPERHPCRGILVQVDPENDRPLRASISARCMVGPGSARKVCSEQITVRAGAGSRRMLVDALTPLLVADLPVVLWWTGRPRPADPVFRRFGNGLVDRVLVDSAIFRDPAAGLLALARRCEDPRYRATLADVAWERLRPWRQLLAQTVDGPDGRARLAQVEDVRLTYAGEGAPPEEALLAAGWLAASFRWQPEDSPAHGVVTLRSGLRPVRMRFVASGQEDGYSPLEAVELRMADGAVFSVRAGGRQGLGVSVMDGLDVPRIERTVPLLHRDPVDLVVAALGRTGRDAVYERSLAVTAEIATLGVTA